MTTLVLLLALSVGEGPPLAEPPLATLVKPAPVVEPPVRTTPAIGSWHYVRESEVLQRGNHYHICPTCYRCAQHGDLRNNIPAHTCVCGTFSDIPKAEPIYFEADPPPDSLVKLVRKTDGKIWGVVVPEPAAAPAPAPVQQRVSLASTYCPPGQT